MREGLKGHSNRNRDARMMLDLTVQDFARSFGTTVENIPDECRSLINTMDFRYKRLNPDKRDRTVLQILKKINSNELSVSGREKKEVWENGWGENLQNFIRSAHDLNELVPKYYRPGGILRIYREYATSFDPNFEFNFFKVLRLWLYKTYLENLEAVYEFGCGPGHNLVPQQLHQHPA